MLTLTRKKGGRFIGKGTYGCVFGGPPLKCKSQEKRDTRKVISKLMKKDSAKDEYMDSELWKDIDPKQEFSIWADKYCVFDKKDVKPTDEYTKCDIKFGVSPTRLVFYPYGGEDLHHLKPKPSFYIPLFTSFCGLLRGVSIAHKKGLAHMDIKEPNIVASEKGHLRLIDFGFTVIIDEFNKKDKSNEIYLSTYKYWPYELHFYNYEKTKGNYRKHMLDFYDNLGITYDYTQNGYYDNSWMRFPSYDFSNLIEKINYNNTHELFSKVDVFSLGVVLIRLVERYFHHVMGENNNVKVVEITKKYKIIELAGERKQYHDNIIKYITKPMLTLGQSMVDLDPSKRPSAKKAAEIYEKILPNIEIYLEKSLITKALSNMNIFDTKPIDDSPLSSPESTKEEIEEIVKSIPVIEVAKPVEIPKTDADLKKLYEDSERYVDEDSQIVQVARKLGSRVNFSGKTKLAVIGDITKKIKKTLGLALTMK